MRYRQHDLTLRSGRPRPARILCSGSLGRLLLVTLIAFWWAPSRCTANQSVRQTAREIPLARSVDLVIVGGTLGAVSAATSAAEQGASVMLLAPRPYLGDDLCGTLQLWLEDDETPHGSLTSSLFPDARTATPLRVKQTLEAALLEAQVDFLLGCYATDILRDGEGQPAGIVIANRAGRQAIVAKFIIDCTDRAIVAEMAGALRRAANPPNLSCRRVVLGGSDGSTAPRRSVTAGVEADGRELFYHEYALRLPFAGTGYSAIAEAEQTARDMTYRDGQLRSAECMTIEWIDPILSEVEPSAWMGPRANKVDHFRPRGIDRLFVFGRAADVPRDAVAELLRPVNAEVTGQWIGRVAAHAATTLPAPQDVSVHSLAAEPSDSGDVREILTGLRPTNRVQQAIPSPEVDVPVLENVDIVVIGGGTSGACAAIAAARQGANVLVAEYQEGLGGVGTVGLIGHPYHGQNVGFTREVPFPDKKGTPEHKMEWFRREIRKAGGTVWCRVLGCGVYVQDDRVRGAVVATPAGRGVVLADVVIDATGNADLAIAAGADFMYGGDAEAIALQGTGLPMRPLDSSYVNTDYLLVDEADVVDVWRALVGVRLASGSKTYDVGTFIQNRERRRVVGDHILTYLDQIIGRTYPDSVVFSGSDYDSHGYPSDPYFALIPHTEKTLRANHPAPGGTCFTPYRCLLPRGVRGMLVIGLGMSMDRDATAMVRMQKDMHNQGYAAGVAAAMAVGAGCTPRHIDVRALQEHLVQIGNLPSSVLDHTDSYPFSEDRVRAAVTAVGNPKLDRNAKCRELAIVLAHRESAHSHLSEAFRSSSGDARLVYAKILGFFGDAQPIPVLADALHAVDSWDDKIFQGSMAEYAHLPTPVDALILALGHTREPSALPEILSKLETLDANVTLSHHRAVALALEQIGDPAAAEPLARLLDKPEMRGHAMTGLEPLHDRDRQRRRRIGPLREIVLARALYHCGDCDGLGKTILEEYTHDVRGLFARHATGVLNQGR